MQNKLEEFESKLGYSFKNRDLLILALSHTTYVFEHKGKHYESNQRLEFVGDAILGATIGSELYRLKPHADEGYLSKTRSLIVCEKSLAIVARRLNIGQILLLGKGEMACGGNDKDSTLADTVEALIAAIYLDSDLYEAQKVILSNLKDIIDDAINGRIINDYKSKLLEYANSKESHHQISFETVAQRGPAHDREFDVVVLCDGEEIGYATGKSKKEAEQNASKQALQLLRKKNKT